MGDKKVQVFHRGEGNVQTTQTAGMEREELIVTPEAWVGMVQTQPQFTSGWHHHGEYDTYIYVISGQIKLEFGEDGKESCVAKTGEVAFVPKHTVHRESNPGNEKHLLFGVRVGKGAPVFTLDSPEK
jgi:uncharacterized RmlC-like cupin family protein